MLARSALTAVLLLVLALAAGGRPPGVQAAAFAVTKTADTNDGACDADCSLREAIIAANANPGADTITLTADVYTYAIPGSGEDSSATGDLDVTDDLTMTGAGSGTTVLDANGAFTGDGAMDVIGAINVAITGLTIENGTAPCCGGGLWNGEADLDLTDVALTNNTAPEGGGLWNGGTATITDVIISGNTADQRGGGIYSSGTLTLASTTLSNNTATQFEGGGIHIDGGSASLTDSTISENTAGATGGGIRNDATLTISNSVVSDNTAGDSGGGIQTRFGSLNLTGSSVSGNTAATTGGGIFNDAGLTVTNSTISGNASTEQGGGIYNEGVLTVTNATISANTAETQPGGGILSTSLAQTTLTNVTVANNTSPNGSAIATISSPVLKNTILAGDSLPTCHGLTVIASQGHNLIQDTSGCTIQGDTTGNITGVDPLLGPLADNGGTTQTHALLDGSPAIDKGSNDCPPPATDQRGVARPQGLACDIGALESALGALVWGDDNCSGEADPIDSLLTLRFDAGLSTNTGACPGMGEVVEVAGASPHPWGDVDCGGDVNPVDSLKLLRFDAGLDVAQAAGCPEIGEAVTVIV